MPRSRFPTAWSEWEWNHKWENYSRYRRVANTGDDDADFEFEYDPEAEGEGEAATIVAQTSAPRNEYPPDSYYTYQTPVQDTRVRPVQNSRGTKGNSKREDALNRDFKIHLSHEFTFGRVFKALWTEPVGNTGTVITDNIREVMLGGIVYTSIRRFVIINPYVGHCLCLPILTYGGQATLKPGVKPADHTVIYTGEGPKMRQRERLTNMPLRMTLGNNREKLDYNSRMNYAKVYTVEHNIKVYFIGEIAPKYRQQLYQDYLRIHGMDGSTPSYAIPQDQTISHTGGSNWPNPHPATSASMPRNIAITPHLPALVTTVPTLPAAVQPPVPLEQSQAEPHEYDESLYDAN